MADGEMMNGTFASSNSTDGSADVNGNEWMTKDDAAWILTNAFLVLTMQSGFGLLEAGCVSNKNVANIMVKNVVDVTLGGLTYWTFGYGLSFGRPSNWFCGMGDFFLRTDDVTQMGSLYTKYVFQFSFATAATTIVSGAIAERMKFTSYMVFSVLNTFVYCFPASWVWNDTGWLKHLGFFDFAGSCVVHLTGGTSAFVAAWMLGPRLGRFGPEDNYEMNSPVTALTGTFMLWWAWLGFNCGSSFGVGGTLWKSAAKVGLTTLNGSVGGGIAGLIFSAIVYKGHYSIDYIILSVLGGLVSVTASCAVIEPLVAIILGALGALAAIGLNHLLDYLAFIDDPVGAVPVHFGSAAVGTLAVGLFAKEDFPKQLAGLSGLFYGGGLYLFSVQLCGMLIMMLWSGLSTALIFYLMDKTIGVRVTAEEEILGADWVEHRVRSVGFAHKLEQAFRRLDVADDAVESLIKKIAAETEDSGRRGGKHDGRRVRKLSKDERQKTSLALKVKQVYDSRQQSNHLIGHALRGIPMCGPGLMGDNDAGQEQLPGAPEKPATPGPSTTSRPGSQRKVTWRSGTVSPAKDPITTVTAETSLGGRNIPEEEGASGFP